MIGFIDAVYSVSPACKQDTRLSHVRRPELAFTEPYEVEEAVIICDTKGNASAKLDAYVLVQIVKAHLRCGLLEGIPGVVHGHDLLAPLLLRECPKIYNLPDTANICKHIVQKDATYERAATTQVPHGPESIASSQLHAGLVEGICQRIAQQRFKSSRHDAVLHMTVHTRESTCVPWVLMILMVSPFFMRTALPLPPGIRIRSVLGLASTAVAAAAEMHILPEIGNEDRQTGNSSGDDVPANLSACREYRVLPTSQSRRETNAADYDYWA